MKVEIDRHFRCECEHLMHETVGVPRYLFCMNKDCTHYNELFDLPIECVELKPWTTPSS